MANVPSLQSAATQPTLINVSPGALYTQVTKPADGAFLLVSGYASGSQDQRVYGPALYTISGTFVGSTIGESMFGYRPTFVDIFIETATAKVEKVLNTEEAYCQFSLAELTAENVRDSLPGSYWQQPVATVTTSNDPLMAGQVRHNLTVGGLRLVAPQCIAFISPNRRIGLASGPFSTVMVGYNAIGTEGFEAAFSRGKETVWRARYDLIQDTSRTIGDQLFQMCVRQSS